MVRCAAFVLALAVCLPTFGGEAPAERLFIIERSVNSNIVVYDANMVPGRLFNRARPVDAYWIMREQGSRREELNYIEKNRAYGFDIEPVREGRHYRMAIRSFRDRLISIVMEKDRPRAIIDINGRRSYLSRIYIASSGSSNLPSVDHMVLHGVDTASGRRLLEKITAR
jgi:hypothetical protein